MIITGFAKYSMDKQKLLDSMRVTNSEIAAFVEGVADKPTRRRVLAASMVDVRIRQRISLLEASDADPLIEDLPDQLTPDVERTTAFVENAIGVLHQTQLQVWKAFTERHKGGGLWAVSEDVRGVIRETLHTVTDTTLAIGSRIALDLPCFAPASASPVYNSLDVLKQVISTRDGVRLEFHQLPGAPERFRVLVDASGHQPTQGKNPSAIGTTQGDDFGYNIAYLTLEDSEGETVDRHVLIVALNGQGRGFTEFSLGGEGIYAMPLPKGQCRLAGVSLSQVWGDNVSEGDRGTPL